MLSHILKPSLTKKEILGMFDLIYQRSATTRK